TGRRSKDPDAVVYSALLDAAAEGRTVVLATVVDARGSTPRDVGSKMVIERRRRAGGHHRRRL
ncbi:MAG: hypothetical protein GWM90_17440, partial [Gemmatimonadetes bacterium]|nr:XdhC family protein [Gemmatimonadota bacterium]NIQ56124.1 XdhC family protein [Gemmatimonadota bacterium]NIU76308.1 hypothetical protein [Gammaproteobacteria bacterium]NIX22164.1 hypothetical protein [Actinomycetota bacterium]NIX45810.1 hypothetical protein [Gemmatimonadota bacterium]